MKLVVEVNHNADPAVLMALRRVENALYTLTSLTRNLHMDLTALQAEVAALRATVNATTAKMTETNVTLGALVDAILALQNAPDQQAAIDALTAEAATIRTELDAAAAAQSAAEDAADDYAAAPTPPGP